MRIASPLLRLGQAWQLRPRESNWWRGLALSGVIAAAGMLLAQLPRVQGLGLSALTLAIVLGILAGNTFFPAIAAHAGSGVDFAKAMLLRAGIILYGFRITFQEIGAVGWDGVLIAVVMLTLTFVLAVQLGTRVFKLDKQTAILIGAGSAICGAAAVMATEPIVRAQAHKVAVAVATVVVFGTLGMFAYPLLYPLLGLSEHAYGVFAGSTIHEVAQVVVAGRSISDAAEATAVIEKMLRVMMLAPFLLLLSITQRGELAAAGHKPRILIPWFAVLFIAASAVNSLRLLSTAWVGVLIQVDTVLLAMAMAALGLRTHVGAIRQAGLKPLLLATALFGFLLVGGYAVNRGLMALLG
jgi:uncharacterized integral membrane protein (TIGR00698 family)